MNIWLKTFSKNKGMILISLISVFILIIISQLYETSVRFYLTVKFSESGPLYKDMPVFYKGYKIGHTESIFPTKDYKYTMVKIVLYPKKPKLPEDVVAKVRNHNVRKEYIDLISLDSGTTAILKKGSTIDGEPAFNLDAFLSDIADSELIVPLIQTFSDTLVNFGKTSIEIKNLASDLRGILAENKHNLNQATKSLAQSSKSLKNLTSRVNNSISDEKLKNTTSSIDKSSTNILAATENIKNITASIDCATRTLDKTVAKIDSTLTDTGAVMLNAKVITSGFRETLSKRFAGLRIIFGKPIKKEKCPPHYSK